MMTREEMAQDLLYGNYIDMEHGNDYESIDYRALISVLTKLSNRIEALEVRQGMLYNNVAEIMEEAAEEFKR
jgi:hypothetical protein